MAFQTMVTTKRTQSTKRESVCSRVDVNRALQIRAGTLRLKTKVKQKCPAKLQCADKFLLNP
jgi:hypothetical protein